MTPLAQPIDPRFAGRPDRVQAAAPAAVVNAGEGQYQSDLYTLLTQVGIPAGKGVPILYNGDRKWAQVTLTLETAGLVAVGTRADLTPLQSGKGYTLIPNVPKTFTVGKGTRIYYIASAVNRVTVSVEPVPWLEEITATLKAIGGIS